MQPLVLAIEPDLRQAAIVKRIVREKVLADVAVVDSRDAALEAMRTTVPDVLLLSALLSPRDEDELIAHLRTLQHAEHLQTHTIPQLASSIGPEDERSRRKDCSPRSGARRTEARAPSGCDPDLFAEEIRTYLQRASEKKREMRETAAPVDVAARPSTPRPQAAAPAARSRGGRRDRGRVVVVVAVRVAPVDPSSPIACGIHASQLHPDRRSPHRGIPRSLRGDSRNR